MFNDASEIIKYLQEIVEDYEFDSPTLYTGENDFENITIQLEDILKEYPNLYVIDNTNGPKTNIRITITSANKEFLANVNLTRTLLGKTFRIKKLSLRFNTGVAYKKATPVKPKSARINSLEDKIRTNLHVAKIYQDKRLKEVELGIRFKCEDCGKFRKIAFKSNYKLREICSTCSTRILNGTALQIEKAKIKKMQAKESKLTAEQRANKATNNQDMLDNFLKDNNDHNVL